jgi:polyisoprenoid-binding protein YceI
MTGPVLALLLAATIPAGAFTVDPAASTIRYTIVHKLHRVEAVSKEIEGKAVLNADGSALAMVRVPAGSFRSGDGNRDGHVLEAVEAGKYPFVVVKGRASLGKDRALPPDPIRLEGELDFHGVKTPLSVPVTLEVMPDGSLRARAAFDASLDRHQVERPSLLFVKIDDTCHVELDLVLRSGR